MKPGLHDMPAVLKWIELVRTKSADRRAEMKL
jgi:hypothetical protein